MNTLGRGLRRTMPWRERSHGLDEIQQGEPQVQEEVSGRELAGVRARLRARGDVTVWFTEDALSTWTPPPTRCRGGQQRYSNLAILTALTLRMLFHLPLRQTEGFVASLLRLMGLDLHAPDHTTLSRRNGDVLVPALSRAHDGPIHLIVDSTGLKIYGAGEWCSRKHRKAHERGGLAEAAHRRGR